MSKSKDNYYHEPLTSGEKICTKCNRSLPVIMFETETRNKDGLKTECRECREAKRKERYNRIRLRKYESKSTLKKTRRFLNGIGDKGFRND